MILIKIMTIKKESVVREDEGGGGRGGREREEQARDREKGEITHRIDMDFLPP